MKRKSKRSPFYSLDLWYQKVQPVKPIPQPKDEMGYQSFSITKESIISALTKKHFDSDGTYFFRKYATLYSLDTGSLSFLSEVVFSHDTTFLKAVAAFKEMSKKYTSGPATTYLPFSSHRVKVVPVVFAVIVSLDAVTEEDKQRCFKKNEETIHFLFYGPRKEVYVLYDESQKILYVPDNFRYKPAHFERRSLSILRSLAKQK